MELICNWSIEFSNTGQVLEKSLSKIPVKNRKAVKEWRKAERACVIECSHQIREAEDAFILNSLKELSKGT